MRIRDRQSGEVTLAGVLITLAVLAVVGIIVVAVTDQDSPAPPSQVPGARDTCFTYSLGLLEFQCGDNKFMGPSFGVWDCSDQIGAHQCR